MDFLDPKKKQKYQLKLFIGYALMAVLIGIGTLILALMSFGYNFNIQTGDVTQNGMMFVDAHPQAAKIIINGTDKGQTDQRLILPAGNYNLELARDGYRPWKKNVLLEGGYIVRLMYPFLFPGELKSTEDLLYVSEPSVVTQSPDRRWLVVQKPGELLGFNLVDLNGELAVSADLTLAKGLIVETGTKHVIEPVEWSTDNRHIVFRHEHDTGQEFIVVDIEDPNLSVNLNKKFASSFNKVTLVDKKYDNYYLYDDSTQALKTASLSADTVNVLLGNVLAYSSHGADVLLYASSEGAQKDRVLIKVKEGDDTYTVKDFPAGTEYLLDVARFNGKWYMIAGAKSEQKIYVLRNPIDYVKNNPEGKVIPATTLRMENVQNVSFSNNTRFAVAQSGSSFVVYDAETDKNYKYKMDFDIPLSYKSKWMDGHRLTAVKEGKIFVFDFDGTNAQSLSSSSANLSAYFNRDYNSLYTIAPSEAVTGRTALIRTDLIVE